MSRVSKEGVSFLTADLRRFCKVAYLLLGLFGVSLTVLTFLLIAEREAWRRGGAAFA